MKYLVQLWKDLTEQDKSEKALRKALPLIEVSEEGGLELAKAS